MQRGSLESRSIFCFPLLLGSHLQSFPFSFPVATSLPSKNMFKCPSLHTENSLHTSPYKSCRPSNFLEEGSTFLPSASLNLIPWCGSHALLQAPPDICTCALVRVRAHRRGSYKATSAVQPVVPMISLVHSAGLYSSLQKFSPLISAFTLLYNVLLAFRFWPENTTA